MILIDTFECNNKNEACKIEREHIELYNATLNKNKPYKFEEEKCKPEKIIKEKYKPEKIIKEKIIKIKKIKIIDESKVRVEKGSDEAKEKMAKLRELKANKII
jgi:hypothetical protein